MSTCYVSCLNSPAQSVLHQRAGHLAAVATLTSTQIVIGDDKTSQGIRHSPAWRGGWRGSPARQKKLDISLMNLFMTKKTHHMLYLTCKDRIDPFFKGLVQQNVVFEGLTSLIMARFGNFVNKSRSLGIGRCSLMAFCTAFFPGSCLGYCVVSGTSNSLIWVTNSESGNRSHTLLSIVQIRLLTDLAIISHALVIYLRNSLTSFLLHSSTGLHHLTCKIQYATSS